MLRQKLIERQRELGLLNGPFAEALGIPRSSWIAIKKGPGEPGGYRISLSVAKKVAVAFPDLAIYTFEDDPVE